MVRSESLKTSFYKVKPLLALSQYFLHTLHKINYRSIICKRKAKMSPMSNSEMSQIDPILIVLEIVHGSGFNERARVAACGGFGAS